MNFVFHPEAELEFFSAIEYYEDIEPELGEDFAGEVLSAIHRAGSSNGFFAVWLAVIWSTGFPTESSFHSKMEN